MRSSVIIAIPIMLFLAMLQASVMPVFPILGTVPQLGFLFAVAWGLIRGPYEGAIWAFTAGFFQDLYSIAPFGGAALTYMAAVLLVTRVRGILPGNRLILPLALAALASFIQQILYGLFLWVTGFGLPTSQLATLPQTVLIQTLIFLPIFGLLNLLVHVLWPPPVKIETGQSW